MGSVMTHKYSNGNHIPREIWAWYGRQLERHGQEEMGKVEWHFDFFENGKKIPQSARLLYRHREDLQKAFPNPFIVGKDGGYYNWFKANGARDLIMLKT